MRLPKDLQKAVSLARWCKRENKDALAVAELIVLARRAARAGERHCNEGTVKALEAEIAAGQRFEEAAAALGYETDWPGLWPVLKSKTGNDVYLPEC